MPKFGKGDLNAQLNCKKILVLNQCIEVCPAIMGVSIKQTYEFLIKSLSFIFIPRITFNHVFFDFRYEA